MTYTPGPIADEEVLRAQFAAELQQQTPIRPWSALPAPLGRQGWRTLMATRRRPISEPAG